MPIDNFIPAIWSARILQALDTLLVYASDGVVNRDYEGDIGAVGDRVRINSIGDVTISDYTKNADIDAPEELTQAQQELIVDQAKYFNFAVDDVERMQSRPDVMSEAMRRAGYGLRKKADQSLSALMAAAVPSGNMVGTVASPKTDLGTATKAYDYLVDLQVILDNADTPTEGRWAVIPPWYHGVILKDSRFAGSGAAQADSRLVEGYVGQAAGFRLFKSTLVPNTTATTALRIIAGHSMACAYVQQILKMEAYRPERRFSDAVKGLFVYGHKVVRPAQLAMLVANQPS